MALESRKSMIGDQKLVFEHPHLFAGGDGACAPAGGLHSPFYSLDCLPPDFNLFPCNMEHNIGPVDFPIGQQCLPEISWGTPQPLTPTRDLGAPSLRCGLPHPVDQHCSRIDKRCKALSN